MAQCSACHDERDHLYSVRELLICQQCIDEELPKKGLPDRLAQTVAEGMVRFPEQAIILNSSDCPLFTAACARWCTEHELRCSQEPFTVTINERIIPYVVRPDTLVGQFFDRIIIARSYENLDIVHSCLSHTPDGQIVIQW